MRPGISKDLSIFLQFSNEAAPLRLRVFSKVLTGGTSVPVGSLAYPSKGGKISTFAAMDQVEMGPFLNFLWYKYQCCRWW